MEIAVGQIVNINDRVQPLADMPPLADGWYAAIGVFHDRVLNGSSVTDRRH